ncbi:hypothetical protein [Nocardia macrotermitis]|uniref:Uncharacterized protein n=1 Tax=Nocardia macrotermitis TaxID=2585198 RepID=A0A7K0D4M3_9NOCA|nr:hypothetical protein [Nocardia macrotermitis]MQY20282.1 hypothetical protein [Nocardia macrotermitis]
MSRTELHPAIPVAHEALGNFPGDFSVVAFLPHDNVAGVVMDSEQARAVVIVENTDGIWTAPGAIIGSPPPERPREPATPDHLPLARMNRKRTGQVDAAGNWVGDVWYAVTGLAAEDATEIAVIVGGHEYREPIGDGGLAFAFARIHAEDEPVVFVHTRDGRAVRATH